MCDLYEDMVEYNDDKVYDTYDTYDTYDQILSVGMNKYKKSTKSVKSCYSSKHIRVQEQNYKNIKRQPSQNKK